MDYYFTVNHSSSCNYTCVNKGGIWNATTRVCTSYYSLSRVCIRLTPSQNSQNQTTWHIDLPPYMPSSSYNLTSRKSPLSGSNPSFGCEISPPSTYYTTNSSISWNPYLYQLVDMSSLPSLTHLATTPQSNLSNLEVITTSSERSILSQLSAIPLSFDMELRHYRDVYIRASEITNGCSSQSVEEKKCFGLGKEDMLVFVLFALLAGVSAVALQLYVCELFLLLKHRI